MSELHSLVNVSNFFAELDNRFQMLEEYLLIVLSMFIHRVSATGMLLTEVYSALIFSP